MKPEQAHALDVNANQAFTIKIGATDLSFYFDITIKDPDLNIETAKLTYTMEQTVKLSGAFDSARDMGTYKNYCFNPTLPLRIQGGPCSFDFYFSAGISFSAKANLAYNHKERHTLMIDLDTGNITKVGDTFISRSFGTTGTASGTGKIFLTCAFGTGPIKLLSADICPIALSASLNNTVGTPGICSSLKLTGSGYIQTPSMYDKLEGGSMSLKPGEASFSTIEGVVLGAINAKFVIEFSTSTFCEKHIENGVPVEYCTAHLPVTLQSKMISLNTAEESFVYTGQEIQPTLMVKNGEKELVQGTDYLVTYKDNINAGQASAIIKGIGKYSGAITKQFTITPTLFSNAQVTGIVAKTYDGKAQTQVLNITANGKRLQIGEDYSVTYKNNIYPGTATIRIKGKGNYKDETIEKTFTINKASIGKAIVNNIEAKIFTGSPITPIPVVTLESKTLRINYDYTVSYKNNTNATNNNQLGVITITGIGYYTGSTSKTFRILPLSIESNKVNHPRIATHIYTGKALTPHPGTNYNSPERNGLRLQKGVDIDVTYRNNTKVGTATVVVNGKGNFCGSKTLTFKIEKKITLAGNVTFSYEPPDSSYTYRPNGQKYPYDPVLKANDGTITLKKGVDYTQKFYDSSSSLYVFVRFEAVTGTKSRLVGSVSRGLKVNPANIEKTTVSNISNQLYTGSPIRPSVTVTHYGKKLENGKDFHISYLNNVNIGSATLIIKGQGNYIGSKKLSFKICKTLPISMSSVTLSPLTYKYTGKKITPTPSVSINGQKLKKDTHFKLTYKNNIKRGTASIIITGIGKYSGTKTISFKIE